INSGSPAASELTVENDQLDFHKPLPVNPQVTVDDQRNMHGATQAQLKAYHDVMQYNAQIDREESIYDGWNAIAFNQLDPNSQQMIGGKLFYGWQVNELSAANPQKLA